MSEMRYLSATQMREADRRCIEELGIPGVVLMNNAGAAVAQFIDRGPVGIVCGKGNNGGDGYVAARYTLLAGIDTRVVVLAERGDIRGDALVFLEVFERLGGEVVFVASEEEVPRALAALSDCALLVDAMLGTGITGEVRGVARAAIESWPALSTVAVDLPSGLNADTGEVCGACIQAARTVAIQYPKLGFRAESAQPYLGQVTVVDIGIPAICADDVAWAAR